MCRANGNSTAGLNTSGQEVGVSNRPTFTPQNDSDLLALAAARAHLTMWAMLKSPILLGNDLGAMSNATLSVLGNKEVLAVSQDPWGVQARRVSSVSVLWRV